MELSDRHPGSLGCGVPLARDDGLARLADLAQTSGLSLGVAVKNLEFQPVLVRVRWNSRW